jgi:GNAT superfamily N-acetyltransferase
VTSAEILDATAVDAIAALCARSLERPPSAAELGACLFALDEEAIVRGDPSVGVVVSVRTEAGGSVRLLVVDPAHQRQGHGSRLLDAAEADLLAGRDSAVVTVGADAPFYLFAGVETTQLAMLCLLERRHYSRHEANYNMDIDLATLPPELPGPVLAGPTDRDEVAEFLSSQWPDWRLEALKALDHGTLMIDRDDAGISAFCAWDVNRAGLLGPVAVRPELMGKGAGVGVLVNALHRMRDAGWSRIEVSWVGPILPYARVGGTVGRVYFVYRRTVRC